MLPEKQSTGAGVGRSMNMAKLLHLHRLAAFLQLLVVQNGNSNEFALVSRGTNSWTNMIDNAAILLGKVGLGFSTNQFEDGKAYAAKVFEQMAMQMAEGNLTVTRLDLPGHSSGYAVAQMS